MGVGLWGTFGERRKNVKPSFFVQWFLLAFTSLFIANQVVQSIELNRTALQLAEHLGNYNAILEIFPKTLTRDDLGCVILTSPSQTDLGAITTGLPSESNTLRLKSLVNFYGGGSIALVQEWLKAVPSDSLAHFMVTVMRTKQMKCVDLITYFKDTPHMAMMFFSLGEVAQTRGNIPTAIAYQTAAFSLAPTHLPTVNSLIYLYAMTRDKAGEAQMIEKYLALRLSDKTSLPYRMRQGRLYELRSQWAEALQTYQEICRVFPQSAECHYHAGELYRTLFKDSARAQQEFEAAIQDDPNYVLAWGSLNFLLLSQNKTDEAIVLLDRMRQMMPSSELPDFYMGWDALLLKHPQEAVQYLQKAVAINEQNSAAYDLLGQAYQANGDMPRAIIAFRRATILNPYSAQIAAQLGVSLSLTGQPTEACHWVQYALNIEESNALALQTRAQLNTCP